MTQEISETIETDIGTSATKFGYAEFDNSVFDKVDGRVIEQTVMEK